MIGTLSCADAIAKLAEAQQALHELLTQHRVQTLRSGEKIITYSDANLGELQRYVQELQDIVDACNGQRSRKKRLVQFIPEG